MIEWIDLDFPNDLENEWENYDDVEVQGILNIFEKLPSAGPL